MGCNDRLRKSCCGTACVLLRLLRDVPLLRDVLTSSAAWPVQGAVRTPPVPAWAMQQPSFVGVGAPGPLPGSAAAAAAAKRSAMSVSQDDSPGSVDSNVEHDLTVHCVLTKIIRAPDASFVAACCDVAVVTGCTPGSVASMGW